MSAPEGKALTLVVRRVTSAPEREGPDPHDTPSHERVLLREGPDPDDTPSHERIRRKGPDLDMLSNERAGPGGRSTPPFRSFYITH